MDENTIRIIPFTDEIEKLRMWSGKLIKKYGIKGYDVLLTGDNKLPVDDREKK